MHRLDIAIAKDIFAGVYKFVIALGAGVGFIALHNAGPLGGAHGSCSGISEKIDVDVIAAQIEEVIMCLSDPFFPLFPGKHFQGLYRFNAEGLWDVHCGRHAGYLQNLLYPGYLQRKMSGQYSGE